MLFQPEFGPITKQASPMCVLAPKTHFCGKIISSGEKNKKILKISKNF